ncbi:conserved hypothetical protein [Trichodesmium erythraeum IMS101]|uniref:Uncharacterized protein n=1 Tax=Trichodesmium erythraeum (strain IMS101) TaxID=203124 RepID=Q113U4_TRIEI|nr:hypothetical protein [Trichodesmium erythraeum GBRTRLIN201]
MHTYNIHEFSTGINVEKLPDGSWRSRGYKVGEYMNLTLPQIPLVVERAIANKMFEVSKDRHSQKPTFVGREVRGNNGAPGWSVVAVVTPGGDEYGRFNSFYRYFLCQGVDRLWVILDEINSYWQQYGQPPIFNPLEIKEIGKPNHHNISNKPLVTLPSELNALAGNHQLPLILQPGKVSDLQTINAMAEKIANGQPVSWAYDVEAVEDAERFLVIQAADEKAYQGLRKIGNASINNPKATLPSHVDGAAIETAIKALSSGSQIKQEWIQALLQDDQVTSEHWKIIFDDRGAHTGIKQRNSSAQMVRLLTLRAIILPETLPEYLEWFGIDGKNKRKEDNKQKVSLAFQGKLQRYILQLKPLIDESMKSILEQILKKKISIPAFSWLLTAQKSLWSSYRPSLVKNVRNDLETIDHNLKSDDSPSEPSFACGDSIWKKLQSELRKPNYRGSYYQPFADLFERLRDYELASYFYQVSKGVVPKNLFLKALKNNEDKSDLWGLTLKREISWEEHLIRCLIKNSLRLTIAIVFLTIGYLIGKGQNQTPQAQKPGEQQLRIAYSQGYLKGQEDAINKIKNTTPSPSPSPNISPSPNLSLSPSPSPSPSPSIPRNILEKEMNIALDNFPQSIRAIDKITSDLASLEVAKQEELEKQKFVQEIQKILANDSALNYEQATTKLYFLIVGKQKRKEARKKWVKAIYSYQQNKQEKLKNPPNGYINPDDNTANLLKCNVAESLSWKWQDWPENCLPEMTEDQKKIATSKDKFNEITYEAISRIISELRYLGLDQEAIHQAIRETIGNVKNFEYKKAREAIPEGKNALVIAIYKYQQKNKIQGEPDGIINEPKKPLDRTIQNTFNILLEQVKNELANNPNKYKNSPENQ